ncbi:acyl-CoA dehydrogenase family protein [Mycobacterium sp. AZCC_0083]|uniref:acyl-CoA dehydrogenase family protein n=1 Tax=Mycobacterium sp. AZCC_0083 TaxID=2735882 RepID=UPI0016162650|nr:acyl-CoA dehydrogenase family protein [Mycobacterium sp. AZCC_0083]MBB5167310.1 alkylation response protein AidB-like acyl-CoA dehydrogenase [Mycobacterium sp. AZCC_0083]
MDLDLTPDQELLRDTTRKFLHATLPLTAVRALADNAPGFDRGWWRKGAELGWTSLLVDEQRGGGSVSGYGLRDLALVAEEMGAMVSPGPLIATNVVAQTLPCDASDELAGQVLPGLLAGESVAAWCVAEPGRAVTADGMTLQARRDGDEFVLDGVKCPVDSGGQADWLLITAASSEGLSQFLIPSSTPGLAITPLRGLDLVRRHAEIRFEDVRVPTSAVVGVLGGASLSFERQIQTTLVLQCAEIVGAADRVFDFTVQYAFDRSSFGRALASYQALKHRFADMKLWLESAHAITVDATRAVQAGAPDAGEVVRIAKAYVADRCPELIQDCIQMHGGIGVTWEHDLHLYLRRVVVHRQTYGDPVQQRDQVAILAGR